MGKHRSFNGFSAIVAMAVIMCMVALFVHPARRLPALYPPAQHSEEEALLHHVPPPVLPSPFSNPNDSTGIYKEIWDEINSSDHYTAFLRNKIPQGRFHRNDGLYIPNIGFTTAKVSCPLHGAKARSTPRKIYTGFLFGHELDLLDIRLEETYELMDGFVVVESDRELQFEKNKDRFTKYMDKIQHLTVDFSSLSKRSARDAKARDTIQKGLTHLGVSRGDVVLVSDTDEIPSKSAIQILKHCDFPEHIMSIGSPLGLQIRNYLYSFEWRNSTWMTSPTAWIHDGSSDFKIETTWGRVSLADAGWRCSWCFPKVSDFSFKITGENNLPDFISPEIIQQKICDGLDIINRAPLKYTRLETLHQWGQYRLQTIEGMQLTQERSIIGLPETVVNNQEKYGYLLPGECVRSDAPVSFKKSPSPIVVPKITQRLFQGDLDVINGRKSFLECQDCNLKERNCLECIKPEQWL